MDLLVAGDVPALHLQHALVVAAVLCSGMCVCDEERVLPQDRGGVLELRPKWDEHHPEPHTAGGRVSTSTGSCLDHVGVGQSRPKCSSSGTKRRDHISPIGLPHRFVFKALDWQHIIISSTPTPPFSVTPVAGPITALFHVLN